MHSAHVTHGHLAAIAHNIRSTRRKHGLDALAATPDQERPPVTDQGVSHGPGAQSGKQR